MLERTLTFTNDSQTKIPVRIFAPKPETIDWSCHVEIEWPEGLWQRDVIGLDGIQAYQLAMQIIGTELYASEWHAAGRLMWLTPGFGYGFPVPRVIRNMLKGDDRVI